MKLSKKKEDAIWAIIHNCIIDARIKTARLEPGNKLLETVDHILFKLDIECATKIISLLK